MAQSTHNPDYQLLLTVLKAARKRAGVSQVDLAERLGNTQTFVSKCERGERRIDAVELVEFAEAPSAAVVVKDHANLIVLRSLSLAYGLAGVRVGAAVAQAQTLAALTGRLAEAEALLHGALSAHDYGLQALALVAELSKRVDGLEVAA